MTPVTIACYIVHYRRRKFIAQRWQAALWRKQLKMRMKASKANE
jgi:hypothetical protein